MTSNIDKIQDEPDILDIKSKYSNERVRDLANVVDGMMKKIENEEDFTFTNCVREGYDKFTEKKWKFSPEDVINPDEKDLDKVIYKIDEGIMKDLKEKIDHLFDFYLNAEMVNDSKPGAKMFEEALKITQLNPEEVCHVGDHPDNDVEAALKLGMKAIWLNLLDADWPEEKQFKPNEIVSWYDLEKGIAELESV